MVHVKKCPLGKKRHPTTEFYKDGMPQIYCMGYISKKTDEPLCECKNCKDFVDGEQLQIDYDTYQSEMAGMAEIIEMDCSE